MSCRPWRALIVGVAALAVAGLIAGCTAVPGTPVVAESGTSSSPQEPDTESNADVAPGTDEPTSDPADGDDEAKGEDGDKAGDEAGDDAGDEAEPTSSQLIAAALSAGEIDEPTSLLYRLWATFGDRALPEEYQGVPEQHDLGLFVELQQSLDDLPGEIRSQVEPYLKRPSDPESIFSTDTPTHDGPPGFRSSLLAPALKQAPLLKQSPSRKQAPPPDQAMPSAKGEGWYDWWSKPVDGLPFRVWAPYTGDDTTEADRQIALVADVLADHADDMIADMGAPLPDNPQAVAGLPDDEADDSIDVYVVPAGWFGPYRDGKSQDVDEVFRAATIAAPTETDPGAARPLADSGYVLLGADQLDDPVRLEGALVHEVFHVLQYAHHAYLDSRWFNEASAVWASTHYVRTVAPKIHGGQLPKLQTSKLSLHAEKPLEHPYSAYLWPLFMEQEAGAKAIFDTWKALEQADPGTAAEVIDAINTNVNVTTSFSEFAMRLLNADLPGDPIRPRFVDLDQTFPDGLMPPWVPRTLSDEPLHLDHSGMSGLSYRYSWVEVPVPNDAVALVTISGDLTGAAGGMPTVEALVQGNDDDFSRRAIDITGDGTDICVAGDLLLVVSNPDTDGDSALDGDIVVKRASEDDDDVDCGLVGDLHLEFDATFESPPDQIPNPDRTETHWSGTLSLDLGPQIVPGSDSANDGLFDPYYPNRGSHWTMSGYAESESCVGGPSDPCIGAALSRNEFTADADIDLDAHDLDTSDQDDRSENGYARLDVTHNGLIVRAALPVERALTIKRPNLADDASTGVMFWDIGCDVVHNFSNGAAPGENGPGTFNMTASPDSESPLDGTWNDKHTELSVDCHRSGKTSSYGLGSDDSGDIELTITGTLHVG